MSCKLKSIAECSLAMLLCVFVGSLRAEQAAEQSFHDSWQDSANRAWAGAAYWAGPLQDWRLQDGRLECVKAAAGRQVHLLTYQLTPVSALNMRVTVGKLDEKVTGWAGFRVASHGRINDYRHNAIFGKGINAGLNCDGRLFIGDEHVQARFSTETTLEFTLEPHGKFHTATLKALVQGKESASVTSKIPSNTIKGNLVLISDADAKRLKGAAFYFKDWQVHGSDLAGGVHQNWGPVLWTQYTLSRSTLKMSAQLPPLGAQENKTVRLEVERNGKWQKVAEAVADDLARVALLRVEDWNETVATPYRVVLNHEGKDHYYEGVIRNDPVDKEEVVVAGFTGNKDYGFPNANIVRNVAAVDPDLLFFSGDQIYEGVGGFGIVRTPIGPATLDYLRKYWLFGWSFGDLMRNRPSVIIPDDHDVYQGNIWGQGGRKISDIAKGGYVMDPVWVNMIQRTQTAHLPDAYDPRPVQQNIGVYYTHMVLGRISFAIIEDRKFKSGPKGVKRQAQAVLLGDRQIEFLQDWSSDWRGADLKATLSATVFAQCHWQTAGNAKKKTVFKDTDANGWPAEGRNRALREIRKGFAFMYAGDNHLPTVAHHGVDDWEDAGISFTVPSIAAGFPRAWLPTRLNRKKLPGIPSYAKNLYADMPSYVGRFTSSWGHPLTMIAAANPKAFVPHKQTTPGDLELLNNKSSGFGVVRFNKNTRKIAIECYPLLANLDEATPRQFNGWPVVIDQLDNYGRKAAAYLPTIVVSGKTDPVVQVIEESDGEIVYTLRIKGNSFSPKVFAEGRYTIKVGEGASQQILKNVKPIDSANAETITIEL